MHSRFRTRPFLISFLCTALALLFLVGILVVDAEGRRLSFNDTSPALELVYNADGTADMQVNAFRLDRQIDVTGLVRVWHFIADFSASRTGDFPRGRMRLRLPDENGRGTGRDCFAPVSRIAFEHIIRTQRCIR